MTIVFWIITVILVLVFAVAMLCTLGNNTSRVERQTNLIVAVVTFSMLVVLNMIWR